MSAHLVPGAKDCSAELPQRLTRKYAKGCSAEWHSARGLVADLLSYFYVPARYIHI